MTEVATRSATTDLAISSDLTFWTEKQVAILRHLGVERAADADLAVYHHVCQRTGLDPFARQIYMIERDGKQTIQTGIDGFRLVARRAADETKEVLSIDEPLWCGEDGQWRDIWFGDKPPVAAKVVVTRGGGRYAAVALYAEYVQTRRKDGKVTAMWSSRAAGQLAKCAEALALRKAFPQDLSGLYTSDEMAGGDGYQVDQAEPAKTGLGAALDAQEQAEEVVEGEIVEPDESTPPESPLLNTRGRLARRMFAMLGEVGITEKQPRLEYVTETVGRLINSSNEMTDADAEKVIARLQEQLDNPFCKDGQT